MPDNNLSKDDYQALKFVPENGVVEPLPTVPPLMRLQDATGRWSQLIDNGTSRAILGGVSFRWLASGGFPAPFRRLLDALERDAGWIHASDPFLGFTGTMQITELTITTVDRPNARVGDVLLEATVKLRHDE